jgi:hypothetical protein
LGECECHVSPIGSPRFRPMDAGDATSSFRDIPWPMP